MMLQHPVHFVAPFETIWPELRAGRPEDIDATAVARYTVGGLNGWVIRTYFHMLQRGLDVTMSARPDPTRINVVSPRDFGRRQRGIQPFILVPRAALRSVLQLFPRPRIVSARSLRADTVGPSVAKI